MLSDQHIDIAQAILKYQFSGENGLESSLFQQRRFSTANIISEGIQFVHCHQHHWIFVCCKEGSLKVFDSVYSNVNDETYQILQRMFNFTSLLMMSGFQKQTGGTDCGLFAIAAATAFLFGKNPSSEVFKQALMRKHLQTALRKSVLLFSHRPCY